MSKLPINGHEVIFVETHLDFNQGKIGQNCRASQIQALIQDFKDCSYVIICADYNVSDTEEFQAFADAGFLLANGGLLGTISTYPASKPNHAIDNIITKGFIIQSMDVIDDTKLSDHCIVKSQLLFQ